ncbi:hypothetical protein PF003_g37577 [Phytophthora fragariae]|nr:hypothetical protein PF003_g37577 [Phytophthora fragariae]
MRTGGTWNLCVLAAWLSSVVHAGGAASAWTTGRRVERVCTFEGYYSVPGATTTRPCPGSMPCPPGSYCRYEH